MLSLKILHPLPKLTSIFPFSPLPKKFFKVPLPQNS